MKVTKVHFVVSWMAVPVQERTLQVNKFQSFPRERRRGLPVSKTIPASVLRQGGFS